MVEMQAPPPATAAIAAPTAGADCLTYDRAYEAAPLMRVTPAQGDRVFLQSRAQPCPAAATCAWRRPGYVLAGDVVLASASRNGFRCIYVGSAGRFTAGFVPDAVLAPGPKDGETIDPAFLTGRWSDGEDLVVFAVRGPRIVADGDGVWPGRDFAGPPGPHVGGFHGSVVATRTGLMVVDDTCEVTARRRGPYLLFADNENCGGLNVRFMGLYAKGSRLK